MAIAWALFLEYLSAARSSLFITKKVEVAITFKYGRKIFN